MQNEHATAAGGHCERDLYAELDELVAAEVAELRPSRVRAEPRPPLDTAEPQREEPVEAALERLAQRLQRHPDRELLLERLRTATLGTAPGVVEESAGAPAGAPSE